MYNPPNKNLKKFDVIIIGGGPAGSITGYTTAINGLNTLIIEKSSLPKIKPCGGGITMKTLRWLPFDIAPIIKDYTNDIQISYLNKNEKLLSSKTPICAFVIRNEFDDFVLNKAINKGTKLLYSTKIKEFITNEYENTIEVITDKGKFYTNFLVGADGVHSQVRKAFGSIKVKNGIAIEGIIDKKKHTYPTTFDFGVVKNGYGWIFPKGRTYNIGIYSKNIDSKITKQDLLTYCSEKFKTKTIKNICGYPIPFAISKYKTKNKNVLLVGDAAGFAEPIFGEGLHNAIKSAVLAGEEIVNTFKSNNIICNYSNLTKSIQEDINFCSKIARKFYKNINGISVPLLKNPIVYKPFLKVMSAGLPYTELRKLLQLPFLKPYQSKSISAFQKNTQ